MNTSIKDFLGLFKQYGERFSPEVMKAISDYLPKIHQAKTLKQAVDYTLGSIPIKLRTPEVIKVIERMGKESQAQQTFRQTGKYVLPAAKGAATIGTLGTIGAGAAAAGAWAYPMKRLGEEMGYKIEEKKAGQRLRPEAMPFREVAPHLPGVQAMKRLGGIAQGIGQSAAQSYKKQMTPQKMWGPSPTDIKSFFTKAYGKIKNIRFKEAQ